jgi:copper resistance protein C
MRRLCKKARAVLCEGAKRPSIEQENFMSRSIPRGTAVAAAALSAFLVGLTVGVAPSEAHAKLEHASPAAGSTSPAPPGEATLVFSEDLEAKFSAAEIHDAAGAKVGGGSIASGKTLHVDLKGLKDGPFTVKWHVLSVDGHKTEGNYTFRVGK